MATVTGTLRLNDKMSPVLKGVVKAINSTLRAMEGMDVATSMAFRNAKRDAALASAAVEDFGKAFEKAPAGIGKAEKSLTNMVSRALSLTAIIYGIRTAFDSMGSVTRIADSMQQSTSRLNLINDGLRTTAKYQDAIFASANRARSGYFDTVDAVTKLGMNAGDAFSGTDEIIAFSELMNKSFKLSGADAQAQSGAMRQLSQAMASGVLRGDEFNSIAEQAPMVYQAIADYMGKSKGEVRELAAEGAVTAAIVKNAMFAAAEDIESIFAGIPPTFADQMTIIKNDALRIFKPVLDRISEIGQSKRFYTMLQDISNSLEVVAEQALAFIDAVGKIGAFVQDNWDIIQPILLLLAATFVLVKGAAIAAAESALVAWLTVAWPLILIIAIIGGLIVAYQRTEGALQALIGVIGMIVIAVGAWRAIQLLLNVALTANPIGAIIMAIAILIVAIIAIIAWVRDLWKTNMDFKYGILSIWDSIIFFFKGIPLFFQGVGNGIADAFALAKIGVLNILESMANGAINIINNLIGLLNKIPGVAIDPISQLTFGANAAAEEMAKKQAREQEFSINKAALAAEKSAQLAKRDADRAADQAALDAKAAEDAKRQMVLDDPMSKDNDYSRFGGSSLGDIGRVGSVGKIDDDVTISEEDIKLLKDIASMDYQLHYTQLTPNFKTGDFYINEKADWEEGLGMIEAWASEALQSSLVVN